MDRTEFGDDGLIDGVVRSARFAADGNNVTFIGDDVLAPRTLELNVPEVFRRSLPQYAEAIVGQRINAQGLVEPIEDRVDRLAAGNRLLESLDA
jgi:hypothetical protein